MSTTACRRDARDPEKQARRPRSGGDCDPLASALKSVLEFYRKLQMIDRLTKMKFLEIPHLPKIQNLT
ncbi:MAG: hypothetical protein LBP59_03825 [Planctomycetaceae bacterium]|nr:hypothetical protein [Planctomycetaceae bacterium]